MKRKSIIIYIIVALIILGAVFLFPREIDKEYKGILYRLGEEDFEENITIRVKGYLSRGLFRGDRFEESIKIGEKELQKLDMRFSKEDGGILLYYDKASGDYISYGQIYFSPTREKLTISVFKPSEQDNSKKAWSSEDGLIISAPANNRTEAIEISNELLKDVMYQDISK